MLDDMVTMFHVALKVRMPILRLHILHFESLYFLQGSSIKCLCSLVRFLKKKGIRLSVEEVKEYFHEFITTITVL